jgi:hypothetical protein
MPVDGLEHRARELGRLRLGETVENPNPEKRGRPASIGTWRLTSPDRRLLEAAVFLYGGTVSSWRDEWQLVTTTDTLEVRVPPQNVRGGQWWELWKEGGLVRRCSGVFLEDGAPCVCDPDDRECKLTTHILVVLPDLPDVGVWRLRTGSWYAASELPGTLDLLLQTGVPLPPAVLAIDQRTVKRDGQTHRFNVPVLRTDRTITELLELAAPASSLELEPPGPSPHALGVPEPVDLGEPPAAPPVLPRVDPDQLAHLQQILVGIPEPGDINNRPELEARLVALFEAMVDAGLWSPNALAATLTKGGYSQVGDIKPYDLVTFCQRAWIAARHNLMRVEVA